MPESINAAGDVPQSKSGFVLCTLFFFTELLLDELSKWIYSPEYNPFKAPPDSDMFVIRDQERKNAEKKRKDERNAPVHCKHTHASRINHLTAQTRRLVLNDVGDNDDRVNLTAKDWTLETTKDHPFGKEGIVEYINRYFFFKV